MSAVPLPDAKAFLNITDTTHDAEVQDMVDRAESHLAKHIGPLSLVTVPDEVHTGPGPLLLKRRPVVSVTSATSDGVTVTDTDLDTDTGVLYGTFTNAFRKVKVTYTAGRAALDADLEAAVLEFVRHLWQTQLGNAPSAMSLQDPDERTLQGVSSYLLPYRVQTLIEPHLQLRAGFA
jgi:hypothetical protein